MQEMMLSNREDNMEQFGSWDKAIKALETHYENVKLLNETMLTHVELVAIQDCIGLLKAELATEINMMEHHYAGLDSLASGSEDELTWDNIDG